MNAPGFVTKLVFPNHRLNAGLNRTSAWIALMALQTLLNVRSVMAVFGTGGILAGVVFLAGGFFVGGLLAARRGRRDPSWASAPRSGTSRPHS